MSKIISACEKCHRHTDSVRSPHDELCTGKRGLLQPVAPQLFSHVLGVVKRLHSGRQHAYSAKGADGDYELVLRQYLLPVPACCAAASVNDLQGAPGMCLSAVPDSDLRCNRCHSKLATGELAS